MPEKISIVKESGETVSSNIVSVFTIPDTEKKYIITTENSVDPHGLTVLHVSEILDGSLKKVATDEEWSSIKTIMRAIISGNVGSYKYLPAIEVIKAEGQYSRDISVSASASKQMIDNYNAADTSAEAEETPKEDSIFPDSPAEPAADNELIPGISEVGEDGTEVPPAEGSVPVPEEKPADASLETAPVEAAPVTETVPAVETAPAVESAPVTEPVPVEPAPETVEPVTPGIEAVAAPATPAPAVETMEATTPIPVVTPPAEAAPGLTNDIQVPNIPAPVEAIPATPVTPEVVPAQPEVVPSPVMVTEAVTPVEAIPAVPTPVVEAAPMAQPEVVPTPVVATPMMQPEQVVQVAQPTQVVPTAQIVQGVPEANMVPPVSFDPNAVANFKPDATLDEVVKGAQEMFMEGVQNLVQTIQEKVYRDLYVKEAEMKKREALVAQKEQMLNTQFATMMSNITANFNGVGVDPTANSGNINPQG